jgi:hypothetical protein
VTLSVDRGDACIAAVLAYAVTADVPEEKPKPFIAVMSADQGARRWAI